MGARTATTAVVVLAALLTAPTAAYAASVRLDAATRAAAPGARAKVTVTVTGAGVCTLGAGAQRAARATVPAGVTQLRFTFAVRRDARAGRYRVTVGCPAPNAKATVTVRRHRRAGRVRQLIAPGSVKVAVRTVRSPAHESDPHRRRRLSRSQSRIPRR